jgi:hypothetical protein
MQLKPTSFLLTILWAGFLVGYLDVTSAIINFMFNSDKSPVLIFNYIASAAFGKERAYAESSMVSYGVLFHFLIAYTFTVFFFLIYPRFRFLSRNRFLTGMLYGCFVWCVMNLLVVPNTHINKYPAVAFKTLIQVGILIVAIGIPLSYIAYWYYKGNTNKKMVALT